MKTKTGYPPSVKSGIPELSFTPDGWCCSPLKNYLVENKRPIKLCDNEVYDLVTVKRSRGGVERRERLLGKNISVKSQFKIKHGDFLISKRQIVHGACAIVPKNLDGSIVSNEYSILGSNGLICLDYLQHLSHSLYFQQTCFHSSIGVHIEKMIFKLDRWLNWPFNLPPKSEQERIAKILSTWDKAIATTEQLIGNSQQQKKALMQSLLTGKTLLPGFEEEWIPFAVERFLTLRKEKFNPKLSEERNICIELEHIEQGAGVLNGTSITNNQMSDKSRFYTGDILFGKLRPYLRKYWFADFSGVCSTEIWVFKNQADKCLPEYLYQLIQTDHFIDGTNISSGTHMPRADWKVVKDIVFKLPPLPEQQKIAQILTAADNEIELLQKKLAFLKQEKTALMQQLLTGKRRVKVEAA